MTLAGISAVAAGVTLLVSGACLVVFFPAGKDVWGRANDATTALFALLMIPPALELYERYTPGSRWVVGIPTLLGIAGLLVVAVTSGMTAAAKLGWLVSAKIGGAGFAGFLAWMSAVCVLILARGDLPEALAWFGFVTLTIALVLAVLTIAFIRSHGSLSGEVQPPAAMWVAFGLAFLCFPAWIVWLGFSL